MLWRHISRLRSDTSNKIIDSAVVNNVNQIEVRDYVKKINNSKLKEKIGL